MMARWKFNKPLRPAYRNVLHPPGNLALPSTLLLTGLSGKLISLTWAVKTSVAVSCYCHQRHYKIKGRPL